MNGNPELDKADRMEQEIADIDAARARDKIGREDDPGVQRPCFRWVSIRHVLHGGNGELT